MVNDDKGDNGVNNDGLIKSTKAESVVQLTYFQDTNSLLQATASLFCPIAPERQLQTERFLPQPERFLPQLASAANGQAAY